MSATAGLRALGLALVLGTVAGQGLAAQAVADAKPALRPERVAGEVVAGTYAGLAGYFAGRGLGTIATMAMSSEHDRLRDQVVHGAGIVGGAFAVGGTVYAIGNMGNETGSFPRTMVGVAGGTAVSLLLSKLIFGSDRFPADRGSAARKWLAATLECSLPAIGGTLAFNASRRRQGP